MRQIATGLLVLAGLRVLALAAPAVAEDVVEPRSGVAFASKLGDMSLLGVGLRTKTFLKVKVYAVGLYVADSALAGPLAAHKGKAATPAFYRDLLAGDFGKEIHMRFVRDVSADQIQGAFRETLSAAEARKVDVFVGYFADLKSGQEVVLRWAKDGALETTVAGLGKAPIPDKRFCESVFGIWLGDRPVQEDVKHDLVARAAGLR